MYGAPHVFRKALTNKRNQRRYGNQTYFYAKVSQSFILTDSINSKYVPFDREMGTKNSGKAATFAWLINEFSMFLVKRLLESNRGIILNSLYSEYRTKTHYNMSNNELFQLAEEFYFSTKDTGLFLLKNRYVGVFPKTSSVNYFRIESI